MFLLQDPVVMGGDTTSTRGELLLREREVVKSKDTSGGTGKKILRRTERKVSSSWKYLEVSCWDEDSVRRSTANTPRELGT